MTQDMNEDPKEGQKESRMLGSCMAARFAGAGLALPLPELCAQTIEAHEWPGFCWTSRSAYDYPPILDHLAKQRNQGERQ